MEADHVARRKNETNMAAEVSAHIEDHERRRVVALKVEAEVLRRDGQAAVENPS